MKVSGIHAPCSVLLLCWLSLLVKPTDAFTVASPVNAGKEVMSARYLRSTPITNFRVDTRVFQELKPLPDPDVSDNELESHVMEKHTYKEEDVSTAEDTLHEGVASIFQSQEKNPEVEMVKYKKAVANEPLTPLVSKNPLSEFFRNVAKEHAAVAMATVLMLSTLFNPLPAMAAQSGGRIGGSFPAQRSSPPPTTRSAPTRSYGSGFSSGFSSGMGFSRALSPGYYFPRPNFFLSPLVPVRPSYYYSSPGVLVQSRTESLLQNVLLIGGLAILATTFLGNALENQVGGSEAVSSALGSGVSVARISVAVEVPRRDDPNSILSFLNRISHTVRTDSRVGIQNLTSQVALELLRSRSSIVSGSTSYKHYDDRDRAQREFNRIAVKERGKFERETVSRYGGVDYHPQKSGTTQKGGTSTQATMAVVTLIVAIEGNSSNIPKIKSAEDVEEALRRLASDSKVDNCLQSAEILWTPEERTETLTERDVVADYPDLRSL